MTGQFGLYLGWAIILVIAYTAKDVKDVVAGPYGQPMVRFLSFPPKLTDHDVRVACAFKYLVLRLD